MTGFELLAKIIVSIEFHKFETLILTELLTNMLSSLLQKFNRMIGYSDYNFNHRFFQSLVNIQYQCSLNDSLSHKCKVVQI